MWWIFCHIWVGDVFLLAISNELLNIRETFMNNPLQEDKGLIEIHKTCVDMHAIWRPTNCHDIGVDGQIEFLEPGNFISTGHIIAVQSKSGPSYFSNQNDNFIKFYPEEKHRRYWIRLKLPIILVIHNPDDRKSYYANIKPQLTDNSPILINKSCIFNSTCRSFLIETSERGIYEQTPAEILSIFKHIDVTREGGKKLTGIDFLLITINFVEKHLDLKMGYITNLFDLICEEGSFFIAQDDYEFVLKNMLSILSSKLTIDFRDDFEHIWFNEKIVPNIIAPFMPKGIEVLNYLWANPNNYITTSTYSHLGISDPRELLSAIWSLTRT